MKHSIKAISGLGLAAMLLGLIFPAPAAAGTATWSAEVIPNTLETTLGPAGIDIRDIAVAGNGYTIYAAAGDSIAENVIYRSADTGARWSTLSTGTAADLVAVAPDDENIVAIANSTTANVRVTINGGTTWYDLGTPQDSGSTAAAIYDLAISEADDGVHYIAAAGKEAGNIANVWYYDAGFAGAAWRKTNSLSGFAAASEARAVAFSPSFTKDATLVAVTVSTSDSVKVQMLTLPSGGWNALSGYPFTIISGGGISGLDAASLSLGPDYQAGDADERLAFIGLAVSGGAVAQSGIYRLDNTTLKALQTGTKIHSLIYNGSSLVAGRYDDNSVYRSSNPLATTPTLSSVTTGKAPGGESRVVLARAGSTVVAGTSGNESAFAVSTNNGAAFSDKSLIDTTLVNITDVAVKADASEVYLVTDDGSDLSLWRQASAWQRVLSQPGTTGYIVRLGTDSAVYLARKGTTTVFYNANRGDTVWYTRACAINIKDMVAESDDVAYALNSNGYVSETRNGGYSWLTAIATGLNSGATIVSTGSENLLATSQDGYIAYSTGGNDFWTEIDDRVPGGGNIQTIADDDFASNGIIYAASDVAAQDIWKWEIGSSTEWTDIFNNRVPGSIYGLAMDAGTLYALEYNAATGQSTLWQCTSPRTASTTVTISWGSSKTTAQTDTSDNEVHLNATPRALKVSTGKLWAVKTNGTNKLYSLTYVTVRVSTQGPASGSYIQVNPVTGLAHDVGLDWARPANTEATEYELQIALDADFEVIIATTNVTSEENPAFVMVGPRMTGDANVSFMPGQTYYWRVRITQPLYSQYSAGKSFTIAPVGALVIEPLLPKNGTAGVSRTPSFSWKPISGATGYNLVLAEDAAMNTPIIDTTTTTTAFAVTMPLEYGKTYFWRVKALGTAMNDWSSVWNFTVMANAAAAPPVIILPDEPSVSVSTPEAPSPTTITLPPAPTPDIPNFLPVAIVIAVALLLGVIALIIRFTVRQPFRALTGLRGRLNELGEGLTRQIRRLLPQRILRAAGSQAARATDQSLSFAARSFLWMTSTGAQGGDTPMLPTDEERAMGGKLAARVQALAGARLLYKDFPEDAAAFLHIWSRYGSREETDRYLTRSFQSNKQNVIKFLKCYLGTTRVAEFDQARYDAIAAVVNPDSVHEALTRLYGNIPPAPEETVSPERVLAAHFAYFYQLSQEAGETAQEESVRTKTA